MHHRERLTEARHQLTALAHAEQEWLQGAPYRLVHEHDMRAGRYVVRAQLRQPVPVEILAAVESIARSLRASLDDLAAGLADVPTKFPVHASLPVFAQRSRKPLARMPDAAQAAIEAMQPYHAIGGFQNGPLWLLDQLAAAERPRLAAGAMREGAELGVNTRRKVDLVGDVAVPAGAFDDGAVVAAVQARIVGPDPKLDMFLRAEFALAFERRGPARGREVVPCLEELCAFVEDEVIVPLERTITSS